MSVKLKLEVKERAEKLQKFKNVLGCKWYSGVSLNSPPRTLEEIAPVIHTMVFVWGKPEINRIS